MSPAILPDKKSSRGSSMLSLNRTKITLLAMGFSLAFTTGALADGAASTISASDSSNAESTVKTPNTAEGKGEQLQEILITAERREETVQTTPIRISWS